MVQIPQSTSRVVMLKLFLTGTTTAATGKTLAIVLSKAGGAFANPSAGATNAAELANGWYSVTLSTTDSGTLGDLIVRGTASGCDDSERLFAVVKATNGGLTGVPDAAANANGGLPILSSSGTTLGYTISTLTTYTNNTPQTGDAFALIGAAGSGLTSLAPSSTAMSTAQWTNARAGYLENINVTDLVATRSDVFVRRNTAQGGSTAAIQLDGGASSIDNFYQWMNVRILSGTGAGQVARITAYNGTNKSANATFFTAPDNTSVFGILPATQAAVGWMDVSPAQSIATVVWLNSTRTLSTTGNTGVWAAASRTLTAGTNIQLPSNGLANVTAWTVAITGNITGNLSGSIGSYTGDTPQTGDGYALANGANGFAAIKTDTGNLVTRITSTLFSGITRLSEWLGLIAGKQTGNSTARTEIRATGAGSGTYDETTDSQEALRDAGASGDPWTTTLPGGYAPGTAGHTVGTYLNAPVASVPTASQNADALLIRHHEGGADGGRTVSSCFQGIRNRRAFDFPATGQFTVFAANDSTPAWDGSFVADGSAAPVTDLDPS